MRNWLARQFRTFRKVYVWWRDQLTTLGKVVFLIMVCSLPTLADSGAVLAVAFITSSIMLIVASSASYLYRARLTTHATIPRRWMQSESRVIQLEITNRSRLALYESEVRLLPTEGVWEIIDSQTRIAFLAPGESTTISATVKSLRRGLCQLPRLEATTLFPLRLIRRRETHSISRQALILPFYHELLSLSIAQNVPNLARGNSLALQTVGLTGEYVGSREYQPGVPVRKWDYSSWARLGQPVVREYSEPRHPSVAIIVDTFFEPDRCRQKQPLRELEAVLSLTASVSDAVIAHGNRIDLLAVGGRLFADREALFGEDHMTILQHLALAEPSAEEQLAPLYENLEQTPVTWDLVLFLCHRWNPPRERLFELLTRHRVLGTRVMVLEDGDAGSLLDAGGTYHVPIPQIAAGTVQL